MTVGRMTNTPSRPPLDGERVFADEQEGSGYGGEMGNAIGCTLSVKSQLTHLLLLEDGWLDGDGSAYRQEPLEKAQVLLEALVSRGIVVPWIYPTERGEVRCEWGVTGTDAMLVIDSEAEVARVLDCERRDNMERFYVTEVDKIAECLAEFGLMGNRP